MSYLDSTAYFEEMCLEIGITEEVVDEAAARRWNSLANFAFACRTPPVGPGAASSSDLFAGLVVKPLTGSVDGPMLAPLRRLHFEAYSLLAGDIKSRNERTGDEPLRRMQKAERDQRRENLKLRLEAIDWEDPEQNPSDELRDTMASIWEENQRRYVPGQNVHK